MGDDGNHRLVFTTGMGLYALLLSIVCGYLQSKSKHRIDKLWDERKARYNALAARNAYALAMVAIGEHIPILCNGTKLGDDVESADVRIPDDHDRPVYIQYLLSGPGYRLMYNRDSYDRYHLE